MGRHLLVIALALTLALVWRRRDDGTAPRVACGPRDGIPIAVATLPSAAVVDLPDPVPEQSAPQPRSGPSEGPEEQPGSDASPPEEPARELEAEHAYGAYRIRVWRAAYVENEDGKWSWDPVLEILQYGSRVYAETGWRFFPGRCESGEVPIGTDVTGDGIPDLVVFEWSGAARGGGVLRIFSLGPSLRLVVKLGAPAGTRFADLDGDGVPELIMPDESYSFWPRSRAGSPRPEVALRFRDGAYGLAPDLMRAKPIAFANWPERALRIRGDPRWSDPEACWEDADPDLWCCPIDLWYAGRADLADEFLRLAWPPQRSGKEAFVAELHHEIESSPYWPVVAQMNGVQPPEPPQVAGG